MKRALLIALFMGIAATALCERQVSYCYSNQHGVTIIYDMGYRMRDSFKCAIDEVVEKYQIEYGNVGDTIWVYDIYEFPGPTDRTVSVAHASCDQIFLNVIMISRRSMTVERFKNMIAHELAHTLHPKKCGFVRYPYSDSFCVVAHMGLTCKVYGPDGYQTLIALEEATAGALSRRLYPDDALSTKNYRAVASFMGKIIERGWIQPSDLIQALRTNDVPLVAQKMLDESSHLLTKKEVAHVAMLFEEVFETCEYGDQLKAIEQYRLKKDLCVLGIFPYSIN